MKQVIKFNSPREHYTADACVVWCFDDRFSDLLEQAKKKLNLKRIDQVEIAGGAKELAGDGTGADFVLDQIYKSIKLHHTPLVILMIHKDCGAYGKLDVADEDEFFVKQLRKAKDKVKNFLKEKGFDSQVKTYLADFKGLYEI